jgi:hypothetical protein
VIQGPPGRDRSSLAKPTGEQNEQCLLLLGWQRVTGEARRGFWLAAASGKAEPSEPTDSIFATVIQVFCSSSFHQEIGVGRAVPDE